MDTKKMRTCAPLLPPPGDEVVIQCLDKIELLERLLAKAWDGKLCNRLTEEEDMVLDGFIDRGRMLIQNEIMFRP